MTTSVIIPCWNALELTRVCLRQLLRATNGSYEIVVVDNGSTDGTWSWLRSWRARTRRHGPKRVELVGNERNRGYAAAMNQGLARARGELVVLGNADAAPARGWLREMATIFSRRPNLGGLAPCTNLPLDVRGRAAWSAPPWYMDLEGMERFTHACFLREAARFIPLPSGYLPGFWFMTRRKALQAAGTFDERFGQGGWEDWDLQLRLRAAGFSLGFAGRAYVHHEWSGVVHRNGFIPRTFFRAAFATLRVKHPGLPWQPMLIKSPIQSALIPWGARPAKRSRPQAAPVR